MFNSEAQEDNQPFYYSNFDLLHNNWLKYTGTFNKDIKEGKGTLLLVNGEKYVGDFSHDMING